MAGSDACAIECGRLARDFHTWLVTAMAQLGLHYAARLAGVATCVPPAERAAALAALHLERDVALHALRASILAQRDAALREARSRRFRRRTPFQYLPRPARPKRKVPAHRLLPPC
jgi:hypothetical protein